MAQEEFDGLRYRLRAGLKRVWKNPSPGSNFAAQTINTDLSGVAAVMVIFGYSTSLSTGSTAAIGLIEGRPCSAFITSGLNTSGAATMYRRNFTPTATGIEFDACYAKSTTSTSAGSTSNSNLIPLAIYAMS